MVAGALAEGDPEVLHPVNGLLESLDPERQVRSDWRRWFLRQVRGFLFADYVRTIRRHRDVDWSLALGSEDLSLVQQHIAAEAWFPMATFERLGVAIICVVGDCSFAVPYAWGRASASQLSNLYKELIVPDSPSKTVLQVHGLRGMFFNFDPVLVTACSESSAEIELNYQMRDIPEAAACYQAMGFYEALINLSSGLGGSAVLTKRRWEGHSKSTLHLTWEQPVASRGTGELALVPKGPDKA